MSDFDFSSGDKASGEHVAGGLGELASKTNGSFNDSDQRSLSGSDLVGERQRQFQNALIDFHEQSFNSSSLIVQEFTSYVTCCDSSLLPETELVQQVGLDDLVQFEKLLKLSNSIIRGVQPQHLQVLRFVSYILDTLLDSYSYEPPEELAGGLLPIVESARQLCLKNEVSLEGKFIANSFLLREAEIVLTLGDSERALDLVIAYTEELEVLLPEHVPAILDAYVECLSIAKERFDMNTADWSAAGLHSWVVGVDTDELQQNRVVRNSYARALQSLAHYYEDRFAQESAFEVFCMIAEHFERFDPEHPALAACLVQQGEQLEGLANYNQAAVLYDRAIAIYTKLDESYAERLYEAQENRAALNWVVPADDY